MEKIESKNPRFLLKILKWISLSVFSLLLLAAGSGFIIVTFYGDKIKDVFIKELNTRLKAEIYASDISFTVFEHFPYASLKFSNISAKDATERKRKDTLLTAKTLLLNFSILDLYYKNYKIRRIDLRNGTVKLKIYKDLSDNYHFWKETSIQSESRVDFRLENVSLENILILYTNEANQQKISLLAKDIALTGRFRDEHYSLKVKGIAGVGELRLSRESLARGKVVTLDLAMAVDNRRGVYTFQKGDLEMGSLSFRTKGTLTFNDNEKSLDFSVVSKEAELQALISELPSSWQGYFKDYDFSGKLAFSMTLIGKIMGKETTGITAVFSLSDASVKRKGENIALEGVYLKGSYEYGDAGDSSRQQLRFDSFSARLKSGIIKGSATIDGFDKPLIRTKLNASFDLDDLRQFLNNEDIEKLAGKADLEIDFAGRMQNDSSFSVRDFLSSTVTGVFKCSALDFKLRTNQISLEKTSGTFTFNNNDVRAENMQGSLSGNDYILNGMFRNLLPNLFIKDQPLGITADLRFTTLKLASLLKADATKSASDPVFSLPENLEANISFRAGQLEFERFKATRVNAVFRYSANRLFVRSMTMDALDGQVSALGSVDASGDKTISCYGKINFTKIDLRKTFYEMGNFGQSFLLHDNLQGKGSGNSEFSFLMDRGFNINPASVLASVSLNITQGELINYKPIQGLGKFIRVDDLSHVRFSSLQNDILIRDSKIIIPMMNVSSDAINFKISGTHTFKNELDYKIQLKLSEILWKKARKAKKENEEFGIVENETKSGGGTTLFISMTGTAENPVFKYDIGSVKKKIKAGFVEEKETMKSILSEEFGKNRAGLDSVSMREREDIQKQESGQFLFEWEGQRLDSTKATSKKTTKQSQKKSDQQKFKVEWDGESK